MTEAKNLAVNSIKTLLEKENIKKILYIDDKFDISKQEQFFIGQMKFVKSSGDIPKEIEEFSNINWTVPDAVFEQQIKDYWKENDKTLSLKRICDCIDNDTSSNIKPALEIKDVLGDVVELYTPDEWVEKNKNELESLKDGERFLCLFDFEFENWDGFNGAYDGVGLAKQLVEGEHKEKVCCGIFSHKYDIENEDEKRYEYSSTYSLDAKLFYTVSKKRFAFDPQMSAFAEGVKNIISLKYIEDLKDKSIELLEKSFQSSIKELNALSPKTFNQIIQKASVDEGVWEANTLFRLQHIIQNYSNYKLFTNDDVRGSFENSMSKIRDLDFEKTGYKFPHKDQRAIEIHEKEVYYEKEIVNKLHFPISNGDIFKIGNSKYILLSQPCNLAIRQNGKRGFNYGKGFLIPLKEIKSSEGDLPYPRYKKLRTTSPDLKTYADFPNFKTISLDMLDLCVYNTEGESRIDLNEEKIENNLIHFTSLKRYEKIHSELSKQGNAYVAFNDIKSQVQGDLRGKVDILKPFFKKPDCIKELRLGNHNLFNIQRKSFDFGISRIKNYRDPYSTDLLQSFMQYLSRNGFDVDFTQY